MSNDSKTRSEDAFAPFDRLKEAVRAAVDPLGVDVIAWVVLPGDEGHPGGLERACQFIFRVRPEAFDDEATRKTRQQFEEMMEEQKVVDRNEHLDKEVQAIKDGGELIRLEDGGIFPDSPDK